MPYPTIMPHAISPKSELALGSMDNGSGASAVIGAANRAQYYPIVIPQPVTFTRLFVFNGATASGNIDVGIYTHAGAKIVTAGSTAQAGVNTLQFFTVAQTSLPPGNYYVAASLDNNTGTVRMASFSVSGFLARLAGVGYMATAFPLPTTLTFTAGQIGLGPICGAEIGRIV